MKQTLYPIAVLVAALKWIAICHQPSAVSAC